MIWTPKSGIEYIYIYRERESLFKLIVVFYYWGFLLWGGSTPTMKHFIYGFLILLLLVYHYYYYYLPISCDVSVCHFHDDLQNLPKGWVLKPSTWRMSFFPEQRCDDVNVIGRFFFCKCVLCTRWFKPWPFHPQTLEVTKHHWKGSRKLTIPKRALCIESPGNFCLLVGH